MINNISSDYYFNSSNKFLLLFYNFIFYNSFLLIIDLFIHNFIKKFNIINDKDFVNCKWFSIHSIGNFFICLYSINDVIKTLYDPVNSLNYNYDYSMNPVFITITLHLYHILAPWFFRKLRIDDIVHHILFAFGLGFICLIYRFGYVQNFVIFFLTGLPGCIDYFLLTLVKLNLINKIVEKKINVHINNWLRGPGCVIGATFIYVSNITLKNNKPNFGNLTATFIIFLNGQYYSKQMIENYTYYKTINNNQIKKS